MDPVQVFQFITQQEWYHVVTSVVSTAALVAAVTPNKYDNLIAKWLRFIIDTVALNVGNAENKKK